MFYILQKKRLQSVMDMIHVLSPGMHCLIRLSVRHGVTWIGGINTGKKMGGEKVGRKKNRKANMGEYEYLVSQVFIGLFTQLFSSCET